MDKIAKPNANGLNLSCDNPWVIAWNVINFEDVLIGLPHTSVGLSANRVTAYTLISEM